LQRHSVSYRFGSKGKRTTQDATAALVIPFTYTACNILDLCMFNKPNSSCPLGTPCSHNS